MNPIKLAFVIVILASLPLLAKPADSDQVVPTGDAQSDLVVPNPKADAEQDAIHARKLGPDEVSDDVAQERRPPKKEKNHTTIEADLSPDEDNATDSAAGNISAKTKSPEPKVKPSHYYAGLHVGSYYPQNLQGDIAGITYGDVYGTNPTALIRLDSEWDFWRGFGKLGITGGLGFFTASGDGKFVDFPSIPTDETLTLVVIPISTGLAYHFEYWDRQLIVPYVEGGPDYFGIFEIRSDASSISQAKFGGAFAAHAGGGLQISIDYLDKTGLWNLEHEYGINHLYFTAGVRQYIGLSDTFDFTATMFEAGFTFEF